MQTLTILQLKISKTKKKLSSPWQHQVLISFAIFSTCTVFSYALHSFNLSWPHGVVLSSIPVVIDDEQPALKALELVETSTLDQDSLVVAITESAIFWGKLAAFTDEYFKKNNKYMIPHHDQRPNMIELLENLQKWRAETPNSEQGHHPVIVVASPTIPMPIVIQTIAALREHGGYQQVVLADGLL